MTLLDALLLAMVAIWGANYSIVKSAIGGVPPLAFNAARLVLASVLFAAVLWLRAHRPRRPRLPRRPQAGADPEIHRSPDPQIQRSSDPQIHRSTDS